MNDNKKTVQKSLSWMWMPSALLVLKQGYKQAEAARRLGINVNMLSRWVRSTNMMKGKPFAAMAS